MKKLLLLILFFVNNSFSQWIYDNEFNKLINNGIKHVYNLEFEQAEKNFKDVIKNYPSHPSGYFFDAMVDWWKLLLYIDDKSHDEVFYKKINHVIEMCDDLLKKNRDDVSALFFKGGSIGYRGRLRVNRREWFSAANDGRIALPIVQHAFKVAPTNQDILLGIGIYNYYAFVIPEEYPIVKPVMIFFPKGNKKNGIEMLNSASKKAQFAKYEAKYFLMQLYLQFEKDYPTSLKYAEELSNEFPKNTQFKRYIGRNQILLGQRDKYFKTFSEILKLTETVKEIPEEAKKYIQREANYYLGTFWMDENDLSKALKYFYNSDKLSRSLDKEGPSGFMIQSNLKIGMIYDRQKKRKFAIDQYNKILSFPDYDGSHKKAEQFIRNIN
ncbi:MAG: hypothetical protein O3A55_03695 [Bacteroidetes bacterium]|nr:hypothetical protein [Bacteroidota bacterium]